MKDDFTSRGYDTISVDPLQEYRAEGIYLRHRKTGAEIYRVRADDQENLFSFTFRTPPANHTGVPHILEHAVLCGSERYPLKDPFLVLMKGSAHTFLNAMTYPDKTVYPAASTVKADFMNLLRVYGDAVFFPQLKKEAFEQEGHRLEWDDDGRLVRAGIVLNEMKGSYSSAESVAGDWTLRSLFPDTPYSWDSGGDPEHIPSLSYEEFRAFHRDWYHPSNARIFLYGDHDMDEVLDVLDNEFLSRFERRDIRSGIPLQPRWSGPRTVKASWPSNPDEGEETRSTVSVNWMWPEITDPAAALSAQVLSFILLGHGGAPLQKAIIDSGIGEDLSPVSGLESDLRQMVFSAAVRGIEPEHTGRLESLLSETLGKLADVGPDPDLVEGALRTVEFRAREIRGGTPFGMRLMKRALRGWLHDRPPIESLEFDAPMQELRRRATPGYFGDMIRSDLLDNPHRSTVIVSPDPHLHARRDSQEREVLDALEAEMKEGAATGSITMESLNRSLESLEAFQEEPDSAEDLERIPFLSRGDLPADVLVLPLESSSGAGVQSFLHETFSNGVSYLDMAFDIRGIPERLQRWLPLFGRAMTDIGLPGRGHGEVARELALKTGGLGCALEAAPVLPDGSVARNLFLHLKALSGKWDEALGITMELLTSADFSDTSRVKDLLLEMRNDYRSAVIPSGHAFAALRASTKHSPSAPWEELWYGVSQLQFLQDQASLPVDEMTAAASKALTELRDAVFRRGNLSLVVTSDPGAARKSLAGALEAVESLPAGGGEEAADPELFHHPEQGETLSAASAVSFSALSLPSSRLGSLGHARAGLLAHILRTGYLWENIRMKGGAYGASASQSGTEGTFTFTTYRDPQIVPSLDVFRKSLEWAARELDDDTLNLAVIGSVGKELRPLGPGERGFIAFKRHLYGITDELRQARRDEQLGAAADDIRRTAADLLAAWESRSVSVIAGGDALDEAAAALPELAGERITLPS